MIFVAKDVVGEMGQFPQVEFPIVFGHEGAGIVRSIGSAINDPDLQVGDAVICCYNYCGHCKPCAGGRPAACAKHAEFNLHGLRQNDLSTPMRLEDGRPLRCQFYGQSSFARMSVVSGKSYVRCPYPIESLEHYSALGCGFQTGSATVLNALKPHPSKSLAIFGAGGVGMTAVMGAKVLGLETIIVVDRLADKLEMAKSFGATHTVNTANTPDVGKAIHEITGTGADYIVECTGVPFLMDALFPSIAAEGIIAILGVPPIGYVIPFRPLDAVLDNITLRGIVQGQAVSRKVSGLLIPLSPPGLLIHVGSMSRT